MAIAAPRIRAQLPLRAAFSPRGAKLAVKLGSIVADGRCSGKIEWSMRMNRLTPWDCSDAMAALSTLAAPSDEQLLMRSAAGDRSALEELFRRYRLVAFRVAYRLLGNESDALDAVQDGFVKALVHLPRFQGRSSFKTWLLRVVSNASLDLGRQRGRREMLSMDALRLCGQDECEPRESPVPERNLELADLRRQLNKALEQIPAAQRQTFVLHAEGELSYREIAEVLGISIGTVMSRLFYARQRLKSIMDPWINTK
jgi:RNA polymerase sigma-70 factor (ECF subfamily)